MAYQVDKFNGTPLVSVADGTIDTTTDLRFLGKNYAGYGEVQNENFLHLLENFANTSAPPKAINGQIWYDSASKKLKFYDETNVKWRTTGCLEVSATAPVKMNTGDFWYDSSLDRLNVWNGTEFVVVGPQVSTGLVENGAVTATVEDTSGVLHAIVKLIDPANTQTVIAIVSADEFTLPSSEPLPGQPGTFISGFTTVKQGITLTNSANGYTETNHRIWGTAAYAEGLIDTGSNLFYDVGDLVLRNSPLLDAEAAFSVGFVVDDKLRVSIDNQSYPVIESLDAPLRLKIEDNIIMEFNAPVGVTNGSATPGTNNNINLGTTALKWANVYATTFNGTLVGNVTGNTIGIHQGNLLDGNGNTRFNAATGTFYGVFGGPATEDKAQFFGDLVGRVSGVADDSNALRGLLPQENALGSSIVQRTSSGAINATAFNGPALTADRIRIDNSAVDNPTSVYKSAKTTPTANTIVARDASGNISANYVNSTASAADTLKSNDGQYRLASAAATPNTVVVRDAAGNINVNGIAGAATQANQLQVDGTDYRTASISASSNTIVARDGSGIIRSISIQDTPIGTSSPAAGGFTTLNASGLARITNTTASSSTSTGALVVSGGVGVSGTIYAGGFNGNLTGNVTGTASAATLAANATSSYKVENTVTGTNSVELVRGNMADNDQFRILIGGTASNSGYVELATADDATEPIYVRQYTGVFSSLVRTATLLDGSGNTTFPGIVTATSFAESSSIALKENVNPISNALDSIIQLVGVTYDRKDNKKHEAGLIAEEVNKILPELVVKDAEGNPEAVHYSKITAYLIEAVKTLKAEIDQLKGSK